MKFFPYYFKAWPLLLFCTGLIIFLLWLGDPTAITCVWLVIVLLVGIFIGTYIQWRNTYK